MLGLAQRASGEVTMSRDEDTVRATILFPREALDKAAARFSQSVP